MEKPEFKKSLNLFDSTAIVIGSMIGSGIFIVSADMSRILGSPGWVMVAWLVTAVLTIIAALSYGELAAMMPKAGGQYVYLREAFNPLAGFLYGWTLFLVIQTGTIAAVAMGFAKYLGVLVPWFSEKNIFFEIGSIKITSVHLAAIAVISVLTWTNTRGIKTGKYVQNAFSYTKLVSLIGFIIIGLFFAWNSKAVDLNSQIFWDAAKTSKDGQLIPLTGFILIAMIGTSMVGSLFTGDAWNNITFTAGEIKNPKRNIPLSMVLGVIIVFTIYMLVNVVYMIALPLRGNPAATDILGQGMQFALYDRLGTASMHGVFGSAAVVIMAVFIMISTFGCNNGLILSGARVYYAMANDGLFIKNVAKLNSRSVPAVALILQGIWSAVLCLSGSYNELLDYVVFAVLVFYVLTILGVFILRIKRPNVERPYKTLGYPILPAIYIILAVFIMLILLIYKQEYTWPGLLIVLLGIPVYFIWNKSNNKLMKK